MNASILVLLTLFATADPYASLRLYDGTWQTAGASPDRIVDTCALVGTYFTCEQTVNGRAGALLVFVPTTTPGHFYTQNILPTGLATGRGDLQIEGNRWTYSSSHEENGKTTRYRTVNVFTGTDRIHSESAESSDDEHWSVTRTGDLIRVK